MIVNVRGTHGSGKSTLVRQLMDRYRLTLEVDPGPKKPLGYSVRPGWSPVPVYVVGSYETACGGCDGIKPYSDIWPRVERYAALGHVVFEGALVSTYYGTIGEASEKYGDDFVFAFLDTPLDVCLDRVRSRRLAKGNTKPLDTYQTTWKHKAVLSLHDRFQDERGRRVAMLDHRRALQDLLRLLKGG